MLSDLDHHQSAAGVRIAGIALLIALVVVESWLRRRQHTLPVPLVITEEADRERARTLFDRFTQSTRLDGEVKVSERLSSVRPYDLLIRLNLPDSSNSREWKAAWEELLREWEREVDKRLQSPFPDEKRCYYILPHVPLPLAFALGVSVVLCRSLVLYHYQQDQFSRVLDLTSPRRLFEAPPADSYQPERTENILSNAGKLILHLAISDRHPINFQSHPEYAQVTSVGLFYKMALPVGN